MNPPIITNPTPAPARQQNSAVGVFFLACWRLAILVALIVIAVQMESKKVVYVDGGSLTVHTPYDLPLSVKLADVPSVMVANESLKFDVQKALPVSITNSSMNVYVKGGSVEANIFSTVEVEVTNFPKRY